MHAVALRAVSLFGEALGATKWSGLSRSEMELPMIAV
jgi:hypothetical protein